MRGHCLMRLWALRRSVMEKKIEVESEDPRGEWV